MGTDCSKEWSQRIDGTLVTFDAAISAGKFSCDFFRLRKAADRMNAGNACTASLRSL
jgi:hypothetical protein